MAWLWALIIVSAVLAIWAIGIERHLYVIRRESIKVLPAGSPPIKVLHIGDLHVAPWQKRKLRFIGKLAKLAPDLVIDTGDNLGHRAAIGPTLTALKPLLEITGAFVNGSNDYHAPELRNPLRYLRGPSEVGHSEKLDTTRLVSGFMSAGWLNLNNFAGQAVVKGLHINFVGVDDAHDGLENLVSIRSNLEAGAKTKIAGDLTIGVSHAPYLRVIEAMNHAGVDLMFAGHTHGGQVCIPGYGAIITNCDLPAKYAKGLSSWNFGAKTMILNVVAGLGHSIFAPIRFACRPEVRLLELLPKD